MGRAGGSYGARGFSIVIENNALIGGDCSIHTGVITDHHFVVLPSDVVNCAIEASTVVGGVPCRLRRRVQIEDGDVSFDRI
jgi:acetyltransferase-like isoleucine patch superfamily enzyme